MLSDQVPGHHRHSHLGGGGGGVSVVPRLGVLAELISSNHVHFIIILTNLVSSYLRSVPTMAKKLSCGVGLSSLLCYKTCPPPSYNQPHMYPQSLQLYSSSSSPPG